MNQISIDEKDYSAMQSARVIWDAMASDRFEDRRATLEDAVMATGLPEHDARRGILMLVGLTNGTVWEGGEELEFRIGPADISPWLLRLPTSLQRLWRGTRQLLAKTLSPLVIAAVFLFLAGWFMSIEPFTDLLASEAPGWIAAYADYGLAVIAIVCVPWFLFGALLWIAFYWCYEMTVERGFSGLLLSGLAPIAATAISWYVVPLLVRGYGAAFRFLIAGLEAFSEPFNFGRPRRDRLDHELAFLAFLDKRDGRLKLGDLMVLYGWTRQKAFEEVTQLLLDYGGNIEIDDQGRMVFDFTRFIDNTDLEPGDIETRPAYQIEQPPKEVFGVRAKFFDLVAIVFWLVLTPPHLWLLTTEWTAVTTEVMSGPLLSQLYWGVALVATLVIPTYVVTRRLVVAWRQWRYQQRARLLDWLRRAHEHDGQMVLDPDDIDEEMVLALDGRVGLEPDEAGRLPVDVPAMQSPTTTRPLV